MTDPSAMLTTVALQYLGYVAQFSVRYFAVAGGLFLIFEVFFRERWLRHRIQPAFPSSHHVAHEILWSLSNAACSGVSSLLLYALIRNGSTQMYFEVADHGWGYLAVSAIVAVLAYDAWFYWYHRLLHTRWLFARVHAVHHHSTNPTAFAAYSQHPLETLFGNAFFLGIVFVLPLHPVAFGAAGLYISLYAMMLHCGYELFPTSFVRSPVFRWWGTSTHHNMHHRYAGTNFGSLFNLWDWLMATNHPSYRPALDEISERAARRPNPIAA